LKDILEEFGIWEDCDINDELVERNHQFIEKLNKRGHHKIKKPVGSGIKAS
jgi:hypothetical protein